MPRPPLPRAWLYPFTLLLTVPLGLILCQAAAVPTPRLAPGASQTGFSGEWAWTITRVLAEAYPHRVTGTQEGARAAVWITEQLASLGLKPEIKTFDTVLEGREVTGRNVLARLPGKDPTRVAAQVVLAHYDGQTTSRQAAADNASGVGVMLELARVFVESPPLDPLLFIATDAEEWGMIGARALAFDPGLGPLKSVISLDYVDMSPATGVALAATGQYGGYAPAWLRDATERAVRQARAGRFDAPDLVWEVLERSILLSFQDHGPFLHAGIPAINLGNAAVDREQERRVYHTDEDTMARLKPQAFEPLGRTTEVLVRALDLAPFLPVYRAGDLKWGELTVLGWAPTTAILALLMPFWLLALRTGWRLGGWRLGGWRLSGWRLSGWRLSGWRLSGWQLARGGGPGTGLVPGELRRGQGLEPGDLRLEARRFLSWGLALAAGYVMLRALSFTPLLPRYGGYPATPKDPFLYQVQWPVVVVIAAVVAAVAWMTRGLRRGPVRWSARNAWQVLVLAGISLAAFLNNPYAALVMVLPALLAWSLVPTPGSSLRRLVGLAMVLSGGLVLSAILSVFGEEIYLGPRIVWYLVLQAAYGVWSPQGALMFLAMVLLGVQRAAGALRAEAVASAASDNQVSQADAAIHSKN